MFPIDFSQCEVWRCRVTDAARGAVLCLDAVEDDTDTTDDGRLPLGRLREPMV